MMSKFGRNVQILQTLINYNSDVNAVDFVGDDVLVTGSGDKRVRVWEWEVGKGFIEASFSPLLGHKYGITSVKVSPQSTMLASTSIDGTTQLWNLRSGSKIHTMVQTGGEAVRVCRFSPDSSLLVTAGDNGQVCLWDLIRRILIRRFQKHEGAIQSLSFTPDSSWLLTSCTLGVLQLFYCNEILNICPSHHQDINIFAQVDDAHDLGVVCCDFSSIQEVTNNEPFIKLYHLVTCGNDNHVKLWAVKVTKTKCECYSVSATIELCRIMDKHSCALTCVRFSSNGLYTASTGLDKSIIIWETNTGRVVTVLTGHCRYVACCAFSKNGNLLATGSNDKRVIIWDLIGNLNLNSELICHNSVMLQNKSKDKKVKTDVVKHAETNNNEVILVQRLNDHKGAINSVAIFGNCLIASGSRDKFVRIWNVKYDENDETSIFQEMNYNPLAGHKYSVNYVEYSPCGTKLASCSMDGTTIIWDVETGNQARASFVNSSLAVRVCRWSPDGTKIATAGDDEKIILWDLDTMEELRIFEGHIDAITTLAFTPDSRYLVAACSGGTWRLFDTGYALSASVNALLVCNKGHDLGVQGCDFSPIIKPFIITGLANESYMMVTCGNDSLIKFWSIIVIIEDVDLMKRLGSKSLRILYTEKRQFVGHGGNVTCVKFSPIHGEILGSVATDRTARIWGVRTGICLYVLENHNTFVTTCAFSEDTSLFLTGTLDKSVFIWKLPKQLISQNILIKHLRNIRKKVIDWTVDDIIKWLHEVNLSNLVKNVKILSLNGRILLHMPEGIVISKLRFNYSIEKLEMFRKQLYWLKCEDSNAMCITDNVDIPDDFLCPITREVMREPVQCSDGFTYERAAINEWFLCSKFTSPMTNESLKTMNLKPNVTLRNEIFMFLYGDGKRA
ncbi:PREDICTED: WD repeat, SAM and U-box domain-containing protein 1-like [Ceratosolen solmsi marchali]|uniref:WD repeat, SAM and U-box domain-containing protein 1-like n=1 Tax=Ceratosolen solmsi marchali TaxID=326594 RepID=A0AAJ7DUN4_9HYME|nr:PREDICTED: WD repeat, SAM and U-box domain-containing protein 1-like [Ceratosolen solmsi marchali]